jgi:hypothetical protein
MKSKLTMEQCMMKDGFEQDYKEFLRQTSYYVEPEGFSDEELITSRTMKEQYLENMGVDLDDMMHGSELLSNRFVCWLESNCVTCSMYGDEEETEIEYDKEVAALGASTEAWIG